MMMGGTNTKRFLMLQGIRAPIKASHVIKKREINLQELYFPNCKGRFSNGVNWPALLTTLFAGCTSLIGRFIDILEPIYNISWFTGIIVSVVLYLLFIYLNNLLHASRTDKDLANITKGG
ncbi:hypothetical protein J7E79_21305 [Bacillus sp. ISL-40]|uniref:hypothetical protein n=1 Tax=unclassified Bacillus (in: firmicutes) TaxID=185979 RepID=UPI001BE78A23|nr:MULTISPECIES: hypothetical protein [unclassified Bacillus (in: firmicutes)]MBT2699906.1 hypothetical protein [Bacillus sp. ISL-40]MBT2722925.1 hypothetical protein [Bacillus sp. ISL-46]MBT2743789.1 hypothetical protein [Bacillus sp. ISL-77]